VASAAGVATATIGPVPIGQTWRVTRTSVRSSSAVKRPTATLYRGAVAPANLVDIARGSGAGDTSGIQYRLQAGESVVVQWTNCDAAARCSFAIEHDDDAYSEVGGGAGFRGADVTASSAALDLTTGSGVVVFDVVVGQYTITTVTLTPPAGKTAYLVGFDWSISMATGNNTDEEIDITGVASPLSYLFPGVLAGAVGIGSLTYPQPIAGSAPGVAIVVTFKGRSGGSAVGQRATLNGYAFSA
jgi:hypothetical protein